LSTHTAGTQTAMWLSWHWSI